MFCLRSGGELAWPRAAFCAGAECLGPGGASPHPSTKEVHVLLLALCRLLGIIAAVWWGCANPYSTAGPSLVLLLTPFCDACSNSWHSWALCLLAPHVVSVSS